MNIKSNSSKDKVLTINDCLNTEWQLTLQEICMNPSQLLTIVSDKSPHYVEMLRKYHFALEFAIAQANTWYLMYEKEKNKETVIK